jgi:drug/metabolite transporter (DMT)-like permease
MITPSQAERPAARFGIPTTDLTMLLVVLIWGTNFSVTKIALAELPPLVFSALRFGGAAVLLWIILRWREGVLPLPKGAFWKLTWVGVIGNTLYQVLFTYGLSITTAANAALLIAITPALVALFGALLGIERLRSATVFGIGLAFAGVVLVLLSRGLAFTRNGLLGDALMLGCAISWTIYTLGVRTVAGGMSPLAITAWTMVTGVPGLILVSLPELFRVEWAAVSVTAWVSLAYSMVLALVVSYVLWNNSVRVAGSNRTAIYGCAIPLVAALAAWPLLGEVPVPLQAVGAVLIIGGVLMTRR